jgi:hypothetical protein
MSNLLLRHFGQIFAVGQNIDQGNFKVWADEISSQISRTTPVLKSVSVLPATPTYGDTMGHPGGYLISWQANSANVTGWNAYPLDIGQMFWVEDIAAYRKWNGTAWVDPFPAAPPPPANRTFGFYSASSSPVIVPDQVNQWGAYLFLDANTTINTSVHPGESDFLFFILQTVASRVITWGAGHYFPSGTAPVTTLNKATIVPMFMQGSSNSTWVGNATGNIG